MAADVCGASPDVLLRVHVVLFEHSLGEVAACFDALRESQLRVHVHVNGVAANVRAADEIRLRWPEYEVSASAANRGFAGAHERLLRAAWEENAAAVLVLNPDVVIRDDAVRALLAEASARAGRALLGPLLLQATRHDVVATGQLDSAGIVWTRSGRHFDRLQGEDLTLAPKQPVVVAGLTGACLLVPREAYDAVVERSGCFFDEQFIAYREDAELGYRAALLGVPSVLVPAARALHVRAQRGTTRGRSTWVDLLGVRNRFLIAFKYGRWRPGGVVGPLLRDLVVLAGVLLRERTSLPGLHEAWALRQTMRDSGLQVRRAALVRPRDAWRL